MRMIWAFINKWTKEERGSQKMEKKGGAKEMKRQEKEEKEIKAGEGGDDNMVEGEKQKHAGGGERIQICVVNY